MKRLFIVFLAILALLEGCSFKNSLTDTRNRQNIVVPQNPNIAKPLSQIDFSSLDKIGVIKVVLDKKQNKHIEKVEKYSNSETELQVFKDLISKAKVNENIELDRLPGEYIINLYFKDGKKLSANYWVAVKENNFSIIGVLGEITLDSTLMDELIIKITGESISKPNYNQ